MSEIEQAVLEALRMLQKVPYGLCYCGCQQPTKIQTTFDKTKPYGVGEPRFFLKGHAGVKKATLAAMVANRIEERYRVDEKGCWIWLREKQNEGYGFESFVIDGKRIRILAHRYMYESVNGPIPEWATDLDHLCRVRICVNPEHLEPVIRSVNLQRGEVAKLNAEAVREIRKRWSRGGITKKALSEEYGVCPRVIREVIKYEAWKNIA